MRVAAAICSPAHVDPLPFGKVWLNVWRLWRMTHTNHGLLYVLPPSGINWHWVDGESSRKENTFEHQIREYNPSSGKASWGTYTDRDFNLRLAELTKIEFATNCHKIIIGTRRIKDVPWRGEVLADFTCNNVKWHFLMFMKKCGIGLMPITK